VKTDLYSAPARAAGTGGIAQRTAAGFVILASPDAAGIVGLINAKQNEPDLIDHVVARTAADRPRAFSMLFTAGGELYVIMSGTASASISSETTEVSVSSSPQQIAVHPVSAGVNELAANIVLKITSDVSTDQPTFAELGLESGAEAAWAELAIGGAPFASSALPTASAGVEVIESEATTERVEVEPEVEPAALADLEDVGIDSAPPEPSPVQAMILDEDEPTLADQIDKPAERDIVFADDPDPLTETAAPTPPAEASQAAPAPAAAVAAPAAGPGPVMVLGAPCAQGHHNHPDAAFCSQCGAKMQVEPGTPLTSGPRPSLGVLVVDDGSTYALNEDLIVGREPSSHDDILARTAAPMILTDETLALSRQHARIVLDQWSASIHDLNSSNGTFINRPGQAAPWSKVEPDAPIELEPGDRLRVGGRIIQVELHHVR